MKAAPTSRTGRNPGLGSVIYLDHHATTPLDERVLDAMLPFLREDFGNAASTTHVYGWSAAAAVEDARERVAACLGVESREIIFTSGATESNNLAIGGAAEAARGSRRQIVTVATEHPAVLDPCFELKKKGYGLTLLPVASDGQLAAEQVEAALGEETFLVSVMAANNEIGVLQPIDAIAKLCRARGILFHTDAAQAMGRIPLLDSMEAVDLLSLSAHKFYGPKGVGALFVRSRRPRARIRPRQHGGGHERGLRSGTLPVAQIVGLATALELAEAERASETQRLAVLRDRLWGNLSSTLSGLKYNGSRETRLAGNLNVSFEGVDGDRLLLALSGVAVSSGSACASADPGPSHVLLALGLSETLATASLRFGLGRGTTEVEIDEAAQRVIQAVAKVRSGG